VFSGTLAASWGLSAAIRRMPFGPSILGAEPRSEGERPLVSVGVRIQQAKSDT
jgi:hypothetical protein